jgi:hypothetical protein
MGDGGNIVVEGHHVVLKKDKVLKLVVAKSGGYACCHERFRAGS